MCIRLSLLSRCQAKSEITKPLVIHREAEFTSKQRKTQVLFQIHPVISVFLKTYIWKHSRDNDPTTISWHFQNAVKIFSILKFISHKQIWVRTVMIRFKYTHTHTHTHTHYMQVIIRRYKVLQTK